MFMNCGKLNILISVDLSVKLSPILVACCACNCNYKYFLLVSVLCLVAGLAAVAVYHGVECRHQSGDVTQHRVTTDHEAAHLDSILTLLGL